MKSSGYILICLSFVVSFFSCSSRKSTVDYTPEPIVRTPEGYNKTLTAPEIIQLNDIHLNNEFPKKINLPSASRKRYVDQDVIGKLSKKYGLRLTLDDDISLYEAGNDWLGVKHQFGGNTKKGVDCSGFTSIIYKEVYGKRLERSSNGILIKNCEPIDRENLREGNLVFFRTSRRGASGT
ncbi:MAG: C40 family peptidase, partial [Tannerella sp.]|nr:C40 family peptidase [Tannerella sp.]